MVSFDNFPVPRKEVMKISSRHVILINHMVVPHLISIAMHICLLTPRVTLVLFEFHNDRERKIDG